MKLNVSILDRGVNEQNRMSVQKIGQPKRLSLLVMPIIYMNTYLPPANEVCEGYVFTSVCPSTRGVCLSACWDSRPPWDTTHPPGADTPLRADTPPPQSRPPQARHPLCTVHAGRYGQQVGGTHPTGMRTCHNVVLFIDTSTILKQHCSFANGKAMFDDNS